VRCDACGKAVLHVARRCPHCGVWGSIGVRRARGPVGSLDGARSLVRSTAPVPPLPERLVSGVEPLDRVLGGGVVVGSSVAIFAEPGAGKSTLLGQWAGGVAAVGPVLYATGEETDPAVRRRLVRTGSAHDALFISDVCTVEGIKADAAHVGALAVVVDSAQTMVAGTHRAGSRASVLLGCAELRAWGKQERIAVVFVCQVTSDGDMAGPKALEHAVDAVLRLDKAGPIRRVLRGRKNRHGAEASATLRMGVAGLL